MALLIGAIWLWVASGFWNVRMYAVRFGIFISLCTLISGFFALLFGSTYEAETIPWLLAGIVFGSHELGERCRQDHGRRRVGHEAVVVEGDVETAEVLR